MYICIFKNNTGEWRHQIKKIQTLLEQKGRKGQHDNLLKIIYQVICIIIENKEFPGIFSTSVIPFISNKWNYQHLTIRTNSDYHHCLTCKSKVATGGNDDITNSIKHIVSNHPEITLFVKS